MDIKQWTYKYMNKLKTAWKKGIIQRTSRMTYDVVWNVILLFIIVGMVGIIFAGGIGAGYFASLVKDEPVRSYESMKKDIYNYEETSKLYYAGEKYIGDVRSDLHREEISLDEVSDVLIDAVIATEDEFFREHKGIVPKAIIRAIYQEATNSDTKTGGSTLTQQLIKNQILTNEVSFDRKAKEIVLALRLENFFEKDEILEAYLNVIPYGRNASGDNIAGIQTAAQGIFGINADEINLAQAAYLAGLPQSPSKYTPFVNTGGLKNEEDLEPGINRMKSVLKRMYDAEYITEEKYKEALEYDIVADFSEAKESPRDKTPHLVITIQEKAEEILMEKLAEDNGYTMEDLEENEELNEQYEMLAKRELSMNGYNIHSTIDKDIYEAMNKAAREYQYYGPDKKDPETGEIEQIQTGAYLIDNKTGKTISFVGSREFTEDNQINYAFRPRQIGSTSKPIAVYAPAMEKGEVQPGSVLADIPTTFRGHSFGNYGGGQYGLVSARKALASSYNRPAVRVYDRILNSNPAEEYLEKMGISSLSEDDKASYSMALGGMTHGATVAEVVNAYTTLSNQGQFKDAYIVEKITTNDGEVIYEHESEAVDVFSPQTAYLTLDMMRDVIRAGTASYLNSQLKHGGVDWAGKTGTSSDYWDAWFIGTNPNVTFGTWIGYKEPSSIQCRSCSLRYNERNLKLWAALINAAADVNPELIAPKERFKQPGGLVRRSYCAISGMLPSDLCKEAGLIRSDLFNAKFVPSKTDDSLIAGEGGATVMVDGKEVIAGPNTPQEFTVGEGVGLEFNPDFIKRNGYDKLADISMLFPRQNRELWEKIGYSGAKGSDVVKDDGKAPTAPSAVNISGSKLSWKKSGSKDVVGYRIFYKPKDGGGFKLIGHTIDSTYPISKDPGTYHVKAVDYFGLESGASKEAVLKGKSPDDEEKKKKEEKDKPKKEDKEKDKKEEQKKNEESKQNKEDEKNKEDKENNSENDGGEGGKNNGDNKNNEENNSDKKNKQKK
ncbi:transglycosylase domain-containing protein [Virgibacillus sp. W0181]|uniref:transglycosylase domain-containing protein n=1 Tax=Virgibacillus sp. W0181 TaxID=3391581 RepID=UPI003F46E480